jgi:hypothetical protein
MLCALYAVLLAMAAQAVAAVTQTVISAGEYASLREMALPVPAPPPVAAAEEAVKQVSTPTTADTTTLVNRTAKARKI